MFTKIFGRIVTIISLFYIIIFIGITFIFDIDTCSKDLMESFKSPNGDYTIKTYLRNSDKMSELNKTDYEYMKKILNSSDLYNFN